MHWYEGSRVLLHHVDRCMLLKPEKESAPGCTLGRRQAREVHLMIWVMFCWKTLGSGIHVQCFRCITYMSIVASTATSLNGNSIP